MEKHLVVLWSMLLLLLLIVRIGTWMVNASADQYINIREGTSVHRPHVDAAATDAAVNVVDTAATDAPLVVDAAVTDCDESHQKR